MVLDLELELGVDVMWRKTASAMVERPGGGSIYKGK